MVSMLRSYNIRLCEYIRHVIDSSRQIYEARKNLEEPGARRRVGEPFQGIGRQDAAAHPRASGQQRSVRMPHPRQPRSSAADGLASPCLPAEEWTRGGPARWCLDALPAVEIAESRGPGRRRCRGERLAAAPSHDSGPRAVSTFVRPAVRARQPRWWGVLRAPGPGVAVMIEAATGRDLPHIRRAPI